MTVVEGERQIMRIVKDCPYCIDGVITDIIVRIDPRDFRQHLKKHAYTRDDENPASKALAPGKRPNIGANCDCRRKTYQESRSCSTCKKTGSIDLKATIPLPGDKVTLSRLARPAAMELFGGDEDNVPVQLEKPGTVVEVYGPEDSKNVWEFPNRLAVQVTWDRLKADGTIPKKGLTMWAFDLLEVRIA